MKFGLISLFIVVMASFCFGGAELYTFNAYPIVDQCQLEWNTGVETNLSSFVIERAAESMVWVPVGHVESRGSYNDYTFTDTSPLTADVQRVFYYRLKMVDHDGTTHYSDVREVSLTFNAVQHTWGSIKAMFR